MELKATLRDGRAHPGCRCPVARRRVSNGRLACLRTARQKQHSAVPPPALACELFMGSPANAGLCCSAYRHLKYQRPLCLSALLCCIRATREREVNLGNRAAGPQGPSRMPCVPACRGVARLRQAGIRQARMLSRIATAGTYARQRQDEVLSCGCQYTEQPSQHWPKDPKRPVGQCWLAANRKRTSRTSAALSARNAQARAALRRALYEAHSRSSGSVYHACAAA